MIRINWRPSAKDRRFFGGIILVVFGLAGAVLTWWPWDWGFEQHPVHGRVCLIVAVVVGGLGLTGSRAVLPFYWLWVGLGFLLGRVMGFIVLGLVYYGLVTPMAMLFKLLGRDRLALKKTSVESYWCDMSSTSGQDGYEHQF